MITRAIRRASRFAVIRGRLRSILFTKRESIVVIREDQFADRSMVEQVFSQNTKQMSGRKTMIIDLIGMHEGKRFTSTFTKTGAAHAGGRADHLFIHLFR